jgi:hypothetical protein
MKNIETVLTNIKMSFDQEYNLIRLCNTGSFALIWNYDKKVWIGKGASILEGIGRNIMLLNNGGHGCCALQELYKQRPGFTLECLVGEPGAAYINLWHTYKEKGFEVLSKSPSIWRIVEEPIRDPRPGSNGFLVVLYYINQSGRRTLAGAFESVRDAKAWRKSTFGDAKEVLEPIYRQCNLSKALRVIMEEDRQDTQEEFEKIFLKHWKDILA